MSCYLIFHGLYASMLVVMHLVSPLPLPMLQKVFTGRHSAVDILGHWWDTVGRQYNALDEASSLPGQGAARRYPSIITGHVMARPPLHCHTRVGLCQDVLLVDFMAARA